MRIMNGGGVTPLTAIRPCRMDVTSNEVSSMSESLH